MNQKKATALYVALALLWLAMAEVVIAVVTR